MKTITEEVIKIDEFRKGLLALLQGEGPKLVRKAFPDWEGEMMDRLIQDVPEMNHGFLLETVRLFTSWASDAQHVLAEEHVQPLNEFKRAMWDLPGMTQWDRPSFEAWEAFREKYTSNY